jgi:hypothetical protein
VTTRARPDPVLPVDDPGLIDRRGTELELGKPQHQRVEPVVRMHPAEFVPDGDWLGYVHLAPAGRGQSGEPDPRVRAARQGEGNDRLGRGIDRDRGRERRGGELIMAVSGAPIAREADAELAVRAGLDLVADESFWKA